MKLLYCKRCGDIAKLWLAPRNCMCGESRGQYIDMENAEISGPCLLLGFINEQFFHAVEHPEGVRIGTEKVGAILGVEFRAFVIPECAISVERVDDK